MVRMIFGLSLLGLSALAAAESVQEYCNELYPADSYDNEDRIVYFNECVELYGADFAANAEATRSGSGSQEMEEVTTEVTESSDVVSEDDYQE